MSGAVYAVLAYGFWGVVPAFWKLLHAVPAAQIFVHRVVWSAFFFQLLLWWREGRGTAAPSRSVLSTAALIGANWFVFILAIATGRVLEASLGYFISPLVSVALGMVFLGERLRPLQWGALAFAAAGVSAMALQADRPPWIALFLAGTFALYGLVRKKIGLDPLRASVTEAKLLAAPGALALAVAPVLVQDTSFWNPAASAWETLLLVFGGMFTALPLLWFTEAARRLPLTRLGLFQYLSPTLQFALAVFVFHEPFSNGKLGAFALIWAGLALYALESARATPTT